MFDRRKMLVMGISAAPFYVGANVALDFTLSKYRVGTGVKRDLATLPGWTFTRASTGYAETAAGALVAFASGAPRITDKGLLVEEARTNLALRSQEFDNAVWTKGNCAITADAVVAPDGTLTADTVTVSTTASTSLTIAGGSRPAVTGTICTASVYVKRGATVDATASFVLRDATAAADKVNGTLTWVTMAMTGTGASITRLGSTDWYRVVLTDAAWTSTNQAQLYAGMAGASYTAGHAYAVWGAQIEAGAFPTSYIPTTTASATRAVDEVVITGLTLPATPTIVCSALWADTATSRTALSWNDGTASNRMELYISAGEAGSVFAASGGATQINAGAATTGGRAKVAMCFDGADYRGSANGATITAATGKIAPVGATSLYIGRVIGVTQLFNNYIERVVAYPYALTQAQLNATTTPYPIGPSVQLYFNTSRYVLNSTMTADVTTMSGWTFSRASTGYAETVAGTLTSFASGAPRITDKGLLVEEARTNLLLRSQEFDNASWTTGGTVTVNDIAAPDSTITADRITSGGFIVLYQYAVINDTSCTLTCYVKKGSGANQANRFGIRNHTTSTDLVFVRIDLDTGAITYTTGASGGSSTDIGGGWWRVSITVSSGISVGNTIASYLGFIGGSTSGEYSYLWGAQLEAGAFPTSYIPTTTASATRAADVARLTGLSVPSAGTIYMKAKMPLGVSTDGRVILNDGTNDNVKRFFANSTTLWAEASTAATYATGKSTALSANAAFKASVGHDGTNVVGAINGVSGTAALAAPPTLDQLDFGAIAGSGIRLWNNYIEQFVIYPTCLTAAAQAALTA